MALCVVHGTDIFPSMSLLRRAVGAVCNGEWEDRGSHGWGRSDGSVDFRGHPLTADHPADMTVTEFPSRTHVLFKSGMKVFCHEVKSKVTAEVFFPAFKAPPKEKRDEVVVRIAGSGHNRSRCGPNRLYYRHSVFRSRSSVDEVRSCTLSRL